MVGLDDIEGTGAVTLAAILGALKISGQKLTDQKFLCFGAGTSGMGIVRQVYEEMLLQGLTPQEAQDRFYLVDQQGLLFEDSDALTPQQNLFTRKRTEFADSHDLDTLEKVVKAIHPTILVGCSTVGGAFTESIVKEMAAHTERPIVFPLSNPTELAEAKAADLIAWTEGRALVATGTASQEVGYQGVKYQIGQANNSLVFPGMGLAVTACHAKCVSQGMLAAAAHALADEVKVENAGASVLPPVTHLQDFTVVLAQKVAQRIVEEGVNQKAIADPAQAVLDSQWTAEYKEL